MTPRRSRLELGLVAGALFLIALDSRAGEPEEYPFLEFAAGAGVSVGRHDYTRLGYPEPTTRYISGSAIDVTLTPAYGFKDFSIGVAFDTMFTTSQDCTNVSSASGAVMLRHQRPGFLGLLAVGYASGNRLCYKIADNWADTHVADGGTGPRVAIGFGYQWSSGLGFETSVSYAHLGSEYWKYDPLTIVLQAILSGR